MISYKCRRCKTKLETEDDLSGKSESCPSCGIGNIVPLSKDMQEQQRMAQKQKEQAARQAEKERKELQAKEERLYQIKEEQEEAKPESVPEKPIVRKNAPVATSMQDTPPKYMALSFISASFMALGIISFIAAVVVPLIAASSKEGLGAGFYFLLIFLIGGVLSLGIAELLAAVRDIARNSFYLRLLAEK